MGNHEYIYIYIYIYIFFFFFFFLYAYIIIFMCGGDIKIMISNDIIITVLTKFIYIIYIQ